MFGRPDTRNRVEKNNDALLFWEIIGGPLMKFILSAIIIAIVIAAIVIPNKIQKFKEAEEEKRLAEIRPVVVQQWIDNNKDTFKNIQKRWNEDNAYYLQNDKGGVFEIRFDGEKVITIRYTSKDGTQMIIY